jgi:hypothetical protein
VQWLFAELNRRADSVARNDSYQVTLEQQLKILSVLLYRLNPYNSFERSGPCCGRFFLCLCLG